MINISKIKDKLFSNNALIKNSAVLFVGSMFTNVLNYVYHLVIGRQVSVEIYGEAESLISLVAIISVPATTLVMVATKYAAACKADNNKRDSRAIWLYLNKKVLKYGLPIFLVAVLLTPIIGKFLNIENKFALILIWIVMLISFFNAINSGLLNGWQKFKKVSFVNGLSSSTKLLSGFILVSMGFALNGIVGSFMLASIAAYLATLLLLRINVLKKTVNSDVQSETSIDFKSLKKYILPVFVGNLAMTILANADMVLAKHNLDALSAGQYGALTVVSKIIFFATGVLASVLFSMSSENSHKGNSSRHMLKMAFILILFVSLIATAAYFIYPTLILGILFGTKYQDVGSYLGWFAIAVTLFSLSNVIFQYLLSNHRTKISYAFLVIAIFLIISIELYGKSISAILTLVIISQITAIIAGSFYLFSGKIAKTVKI